MKLWELLNRKKKADIKYGSVICPKCGAFAFIKSDTPEWITEGYCFRCGQHITWEWNEKK